MGVGKPQPHVHSCYHQPMVHTLVCLAAVALLALGCSGTPADPADPTPRVTCAAEGWPQPADRMEEGCEAVVEGCCYPSDTAACAAAGCEPGACMVMESYPAQIRCQ